MIRLARSEEEQDPFGCSGLPRRAAPGRTARWIQRQCHESAQGKGVVAQVRHRKDRPALSAPKEGDRIHYRLTDADGRQFEFHNFLLKPETYHDAFKESGFHDFRWLGVSLIPDERKNPFWDDFLDNPPMIAYAATK